MGQCTIDSVERPNCRLHCSFPLSFTYAQSLFRLGNIYIYIFSNLAARYIEENRVTARVTNQISIRLQNTFLREYRRRTPGGTFTRRFVHVIDAHDRSELAMGSSSIVRNQAKFHVQLNVLFDSRTSIYFSWISIFERIKRKIKKCKHSSL